MKTSLDINSEEELLNLLGEYRYSESQMLALLDRFNNGETFEIYDQGILYDDEDDDDI